MTPTKAVGVCVCVVHVNVETLLWCVLNCKGRKLVEVTGGHVEV